MSKSGYLSIRGYSRAVANFFKVMRFKSNYYCDINAFLRVHTSLVSTKKLANVGDIYWRQDILM